MSGKVKLVLKGFDDLLEQIQRAGGKVEPATERALLQSANVLDQAIRNGAVARNISTSAMVKPVVTWKGNRASTEVGFELGEYNSANPSDGYLALFKEYGAPSKKGTNRKTKSGYNRGAEAPDPFIRPAVSANKKTVQKAQENALNQILRELKE